MINSRLVASILFKMDIFYKNVYFVLSGILNAVINLFQSPVANGNPNGKLEMF